MRAYLLGMGFDSRVTSTVRSQAQQAVLYRAYREGRSRYPAAPPGTSTHERGLAFDLAADPAALALAGTIAPLYGLRWGGTFGVPDPIHFEAV